MTDTDALDAQRQLWSAGNYPAIAEHLLPASVDLVETAGIGPDHRVLDVGAGDGNTTLEAARRGATVIGIDLTPRQLELARARADAAGLTVELREANAEHLPFDDAGFDAVISVFGVIFAPDHRRAVAEMARVCRPGGVVALTSWSEAGGWFRTWRERASALVPPPPPGGPRPDDWGDPDEMRGRLTEAGLDAEVHVRDFAWVLPSPQAAVDFFLANAASFIAFRDAATRAGHGDAVVPTLLQAVEDSNQATDGTCHLAAPYLLAVAPR